MRVSVRVIVRDSVRDKWLIVRLSEGSEGKKLFCCYLCILEYLTTNKTVKRL